MRTRQTDSLPSDASPYLDEAAFYIDRLEEAGPYGDDEMSRRVETPWLSNEVLTDPLAEEEAWSGSGEQVEFRNRVLSAHLERSKKRKGAPKRDLRPDELRNVRGTNISMRADAAEAASRLLEAANQALAEAKAAGNPDALPTTRITGNSGYRGRDHQHGRWMELFPKYYRKTRKAREALASGPHSSEAVTYMLETFGIPSKIAAPGYSNHQAGIAIDLQQERIKGHRVSNSTDEGWRETWRRTWFHKWLREHALRFDFLPYEKEEWHWEFKPAEAAKLRARKSLRDSESDSEMEERFDEDYVDDTEQGEEETVDRRKWTDTFIARTPKVKVAFHVTRAARQASQVEVLVYLHGLDLCGPAGGKRPVAFINGNPFKLGELAEASGRPIVLVVPDLDWKRLEPDGVTLRNRWRILAKPVNLNSAIAEALDKVGVLTGAGKAPALSRLILAGHSRAYDFFDAMAAARTDPHMSKGALGRLSHVWALDTTYRSSDAAWLAWLRSRDDFHITVIYRDAKFRNEKAKDTKQIRTGFFGQKFLDLVPQSNERLAATPVPTRVEHCHIPREYLPDLLASLGSAPRNAERELDFETDDFMNDDDFAEAETLGDEDQYLETEAWDDETDDLEVTDDDEASMESFAAFADSETDEDEEAEWTGDDETDDEEIDDEELSDEQEADDAMESEVLQASGLTPAELKAVQITSTFETGKRGGFFGLSGNFDGQGLSFGLVNWTIGTGSLQPLLRQFAAQEPARWKAVFGPDAASFLALITPEGKAARAAQLAFAKNEMNVSRLVDGKRKWSVKEPWVTYFTRLSEDPSFQRIQVNSVRDLLDRARYFCELFGLKSERAFAFMFDAVSSHGKWWLMKKWSGVEKRRELYASHLAILEAKYGRGSVPERDMLLALADVLAETSSERWSEKVRTRKQWFVTGKHPRAKELKGLEPRAEVPYLTSVPTGPRPTTGAASATTKELVRFAQIVLNVAEGERLSDDGDLGPSTRAALERFRARYGLSSANVLDGRLQIALAQKAIEAFTRTSRFTTIGERDARTMEEIRSFQLANGVNASGEVDAATRAAFVAALSRASKPSAASGTSFYEQTIRRHPLFDSAKRIADLELLEPVTRERVQAIIREAADQGIKLMVWETYRSKARQEELLKRKTTQLRVGVHHYGLACDLVKNVNGEPSWKGDFKFMEALARANKLVWGGDWGIAGKKPKFYDPVHVQRCSLSRQSSLFKGTWYPNEGYDPYTS